MSSVTLALSIDYSLFLLSRFREEGERSLRSKAAGSPTAGAPALGQETVVVNMMQFAGHTVLVSGCTICLCFLALLFFPIEMLASVGIGSSICIAVTISCNCTLTPAMLITFYPFFADFHSFGFACCCCRKSCLARGDCSKRRCCQKQHLAVADDDSSGRPGAATTYGFGGEGGADLHEVLLAQNETNHHQMTPVASNSHREEDDEGNTEYDHKSCWCVLCVSTVSYTHLTLPTIYSV